MKKFDATMNNETVEIKKNELITYTDQYHRDVLVQEVTGYTIGGPYIGTLDLFKLRALKAAVELAISDAEDSIENSDPPF